MGNKYLVTLAYECPNVDNQKGKVIFEGRKLLKGEIVENIFPADSCRKYMFFQSCDDDPDCGRARVLEIEVYNPNKLEGKMEELETKVICAECGNTVAEEPVKDSYDAPYCSNDCYLQGVAGTEYS